MWRMEKWRTCVPWSSPGPPETAGDRARDGKPWVFMFCRGSLFRGGEIPGKRNVEIVDSGVDEQEIEIPIVRIR